MLTSTEDAASQLQSALEAAVANPDTNFPGAVLHVRSAELGRWSGAAGLGDIKPASAMRPDDRFRAGSVMKPFVAVVVLQLVEGGRFSLDDPLPAVLPDSITARFAASDEITVRMLLNHSSGIPDWLTDAAIGEIAANPARVRQVEEYLDLAAAQEPYFPPGQGFTYSNTDYNLLGLVIKGATGRSWREEVRERVIEPLHLQDTLLPEPGDLSIPGNYARGYMDLGEGLVDFSQVDPSMAGAAGGHALVTTTMDLAQFLDAALAGELFQDSAILGEMLTLVDAPKATRPSDLAAGYGLGVMKYMLPGDIELLGHSGGTAGYLCFVYHLPTEDITISGMMNNMQSDDMQLILASLEILVPGFSL